MTNLLQGTTPKIPFNFADTGFDVSDFDEAELTVSSGALTVTHTLSEMTADTTNNRLSYQFGEKETLQFYDKANAYYQLYVKIDNEVYGTKKAMCNIFQKLKGSVMD